MALSGVSISYAILNGYEKAQPALIPLVVLACASSPGRAFFRAAWRGIARTARSPWRAVVVVSVMALALHAFLSLVVLMPQPRVHDEFSYLLAADTFAHGRLTNQPLPDPLWQHFETMHVIQQPTYASKYPPGQGLMLAAGQVLTGYPIVGAWVVTALGCGAICWMLLAWLPARWAMAAALLALVHTQSLEWGQSYWGGALPMLGGALLIGGLLRIVSERGPRVADGFVFAIGLAILANCRPAEGLVLVLICGIVIAVWAITRGRHATPVWGLTLRRVAIPVGVIMLPVIVMMAFYNYRVTHSVAQLPYMVHDKTYAVAPPFVWQAARWENDHYRFKAIRDLQVGWEYPFWERQQTLLGWIKEIGRKARSCAGRYLFPFALLLPVLFVLAGLARDRMLRRAVVILVAFFAIVALNQTWTQPHYLAPGFGLGCGVLIVGFRRLSAWHRRLRIGSVLTYATVVLILGAALMWGVKRVPIGGGWPYTRAALIHWLQTQPGDDLVIVRYGPQHRFLREWVANGADLQNAPVIWARGMTPAEDAQLISYYRDRKVWLFEPDIDSWKLMPYKPAPTQMVEAQPAAATAMPTTQGSAPVDGQQHSSVRFDAAMSR